ncbi:MAG: ATP-binding protein, partial [Chloroflexi bacterium]|nr:ATP-binding protein [Chloroflexota bacterium]
MSAAEFPLPFVERHLELRTLASFYDRAHHRGAGFLLLYGRKGVGKTRLLQQFFEEQDIQDAFYWQAPPGDAARQLSDFSQALRRFDTGDPPAPTFSFYDWEEALGYVAQIAERGDGLKLFILEGFTALCHQEMALSSVFRNVWDLRLKDIPNLRLVVTGSHISTMLREVLAYSAPLYLRANEFVHLQPLRYTALLDLFPDHTPEERLIIYAIAGGIPAYLAYFAQAPDMVTSVQTLCFGPSSPFLADMETLFDERLEEPALGQAISTAVASGYDRPD